MNDSNDGCGCFVVVAVIIGICIMISKNWSRHKIWIVISKLIDLSILQLPITCVSLPIYILDWHNFAFLGLALLFDLSIWFSLFLYQHFTSLVMLRKGIKTCLKGSYEILNSNLINSFSEIIRFAYSDSSVTRLSMQKSSIKVVRSDSVKRKFTTIADLTGVSVIIVKKRFDESEVRDIVLLAHEFGHVFHTLLRMERFMIPIVSLSYQVILLFYSIFVGSWWMFICLLPINIFLFAKNYWEFESRIEMNADITALKIIERLWGENAMHIAAECLLRLRISSSITMKRNLSQFAINNCIATLVPQVHYHIRASLIEASNKRTKEIDKDEYIDNKLKKNKLANEMLIRTYLKNKAFRHQVQFLRMDTNSGFSILMFAISFFSALYAAKEIFDKIQYQDGWYLLWISIGIIIIISFVYLKLTQIICNKKDLLQTQIGLA